MTFADVARQTEGLSIFLVWELVEKPLFSGREVGKGVGMKVAWFKAVSGTQELGGQPAGFWSKGCLRDQEFGVPKIEQSGGGEGQGLQESHLTWVGRAVLAQASVK